MMPYRKKSELLEIIQEVKAIYAELDQVSISRDCVLRTQCCYFKRTGMTPQLTAGEGLVAAKAWRSTGRKELKPRPDGGCPLLIGPEGKGKCAIYADRPFGCRTHFCDEAGGPYPRRDVSHLIQRLEEVEEKLGGSGPKSLPASVLEGLGWKML